MLAMSILDKLNVQNKDYYQESKEVLHSSKGIHLARKHNIKFIYSKQQSFKIHEAKTDSN